MAWNSIGTHLLAALIGAVAGGVLQYYLGKKRDTIKIQQEKELKKEEELTAWHQRCLRELQAFREDVNNADYDNRQQMKEKASSHASKIEDLRENAPPEVSPDVVRQMETYCEAVKELNHSEVGVASISLGNESPFEKQRQKQHEEKRKQEQKERFQERLDTYDRKATTLKSKLEKGL